MPESQWANSAASGTAAAPPSTASGNTEPCIAALVDATGILVPASADDVLQRATAGQFFWLDIFTADAVARSNLLAKLGLNDTDRTWILHFGQAPRMAIAAPGARVVTMAIGPEDQWVEIHVLWTRAWIVTVWAGDAASLREVRQRFATGLHETHQTACVSGMVFASAVALDDRRKRDPGPCAALHA
ncbi:hypothetical protein JO965_36720 (plasmid) [Microvirga sp. VF16]|nr:hypothetical protein JO965_36720 [Microvirga sp. VF16]